MNQDDVFTASHGFQMPHVFVVPPEEDETPAWCCFDAALPIDKQIQQRVHLDADDHTFDPSSPYDDDIAAMDAAIARRNMETRSIVDNLMSKDFNIEHAALDSDSDLDWDSENENQPHDRLSSSGPPSPIAPSFTSGADSDVVEVVKPSTAKRSGTFKARATQAFRSFTGTLSFRSSKSRAQDNLPPRPSSSMSWAMRREETDVEPNQSTSPRPGGRVSRRLSQLFSPPSKSQPSLALAGLDDAPTAPSPSEPIIASQSTSSNIKPRSASYDFAPRRSSESIPTNALPSRSAQASASSVTLSKTFKRFNKLNIQRMFSFSSSQFSHDSNLNRDSEDGRTTPTLRRKSSSLPSTSTSSESGPQTPTTSTEDTPLRSSLTRKSTLTFHDEGLKLQLDFGDFETGLGIVAPTDSGHSLTTGSYSSFSSTSKVSTSTSTSSTMPMARQPLGRTSQDEGGDGDLSFEMQLDSLHFDDISFDVDRFGVNLD
ncbi:hypothetical protein FA13DRAFT_1229125 [Coprinellus micaceus]|uniref:Uncharacterized protein n=1 Tax=Coprinellus micaceus TaxID=71717 RepID=A0A4Y7TPP0_COPMI|nr:hypothetical protein FA13DRAFT_1229125 [Coprinellus micaceus]